jgi:hypothetical protein
LPLDKAGNFHLHPGAAKMHDSAPKAPPIGKIAGKTITEKPGGNQKPGGGHVELHHGPPPDGSMPNAKFHTIHHAASGGGGGGGGAMGMGHEHGGETKGHESLHAAHHAINEHMGEDGCSDGSCAEHGGSAAEGAAADPGAGGATDDEY